MYRYFSHQFDMSNSDILEKFKTQKVLYWKFPLDKPPAKLYCINRIIQ